MESKKAHLSKIQELWRESREISGLLQDNWAALVRGKARFMKSAVQVGISLDQAEDQYKILLKDAKRKYSEEFERMCELSDEYAQFKSQLESDEAEQG